MIKVHYRSAVILSHVRN